MTIELKPCPFCGGSARFNGYKDENWWFAECADDSFECLMPCTGSYDTQEQAAEQWNRRAP